MSRKRMPRRKWKIVIGAKAVLVLARTFGNAVHKAAKRLGVSLRTDNDTGGWKDVSGAVLPE